MSEVEVLQLFTPDEARAITDQISNTVNGLWDQIAVAYLRGAHIALGYESWDDYTEQEFGATRLRLPREERSDVVHSLRDQGLSIRAIAAATGASRGTVADDLKSGVQNRTPEPVRGRDGKTYPGQRVDPIDIEASLLEPDTTEVALEDVRPGDVIVDDDGGAHPVAEVIDHGEEISVIDLDGDGTTSSRDTKVKITKPDLGGGVSHPARYSDPLLPMFAELLDLHCEGNRVLDPFAGTGRIHELQQCGYETVGVEIEPEWAALHADTICASALKLPFDEDEFDAIVTSPTYGNRLADSYNSKDPELRRSYHFDLGRALSADNSGALQWGDRYRDFHEDAWDKAAAVLRPGGVFLLNIKDHVRDGERQAVAGWHVTALCRRGFTLLEHHDVETPQLRQGANASLRFTEQIYLFRKDER